MVIVGNDHKFDGLLKKFQTSTDLPMKYRRIAIYFNWQRRLDALKLKCRAVFPPSIWLFPRWIALHLIKLRSKASAGGLD